jgi:hypothetical protein
VSNDIASINPYTKKDHTGSEIMKSFLSLELPYFEKISFSKIASAKRNELAFHEFRLALEKALIETTTLGKSDKRKARIEEVERDILRVPLMKINQQMKKIHRNMKINGAILLGSLISTLVSGGESLIAATSLAASVESIKMYKEEAGNLDQIKQMPSYFYWKLLN